MLKLLFALLFVLNTGFVHSKIESNGKLAKFKLLEQTATQGEKVSILIYPQQFTGDIPLDTIVQGKFENQPVALERFGQELWRFKTPVLSEVKTYSFVAEIYIEDKKQADITRKEIAGLASEIEALRLQIQMESDPDVIEELAFEKAEKEQDKSDLEDLLFELKKYVGDETFQFSVGE